MPKKINIDEFTEEQSAAVFEDPTAGVVVRNKFPTLSGFPYRIALIGEAPGKDEVARGEPFVGMSGKLLDGLLGKANIVREACFIGNVCQHRPPNNEIARFDWSGPEIQGGIQTLLDDLNKFQPTIVLCLGGASLHLFKEGNAVPPKVKSGKSVRFVFPNSITDWRGSLFESNGRKCLPAFHPAACLRQYEWTTLLMFDLKRAYKEGHFPELRLPIRSLLVGLPPHKIIEFCDSIRQWKRPIAIDIEGGIGTMSCISIATSPINSFIIPLAKLDGTSFYEDYNTEVEIWRALGALLEDASVPKILQNSLYDRFVLLYSYGIVVQGVADDTMVKFHEMYCELEKSLGFQCSILTDEPYYKSDRKTDNQRTFYEYCCRDSAVTYEINSKLEEMLDPGQKGHYRFNVAVENPLLWMEQHGILYDSKLAKERLREVNDAIYNLQADLDRLAGFGLDVSKSRDQLVAEARNIMCYVRDRSQPKADFKEDYEKVIRILSEGDLNKAQMGYLNSVLGLSLNIKGADLKKYLYETLKLPVQVHKDTGQPSTDYLSLLKLTKKSDHPALRLAIEIGSLRTRAQMLAIHADPDGRIRCGYNVVGTETGRLSCYTSPTGSGYNLQTIPADDHIYELGHPLRKGMRDLFIADPGHVMIQCDLKGSDGWTIGAHLNALGSPTMLDDLRYGIKPANRICYMLRHGNHSLQGKQRDEIKELLKEIRKEDWDYFACKIGIWGMCYLMGPDLLSNQILEESNGKIAMSRTEVAAFRSAVFEGYQIKLWHDAMSRKLAKKPVLECDGGFRRRFFGRRDEILGKALSHEPQYCTTRATNLAAMRLWRDEQNRLGDSGPNPSQTTIKFRVAPLHQVHDSLLVQCKESDSAWALGSLKRYFDNPLTIAGQRIIIPFACEVGKSWGTMESLET